MKNQEKNLISPKSKQRKCLSCGKILKGRKRRYHSQDCKYYLLVALRWANDMLRELNTELATFSFTDSTLILNILPYNSKRVSTYLYERKSWNKSPAQDFRDMLMQLEREWYKKMWQTQSFPIAKKHILDSGEKNLLSPDSLKPITQRNTTSVEKQLSELNISLDELFNTEPELVIKNAWRRKAKKHHPDISGDVKTFIEIQKAYQEINEWLKNPIIKKRSGVPDQWSYDGKTRQWKYPL